MKTKIILILFIGLFLINFISADQVLWDNDTIIEVYDTWRDVDGTPLTGATCTWYVYNPIGTLNDSGIPTEFTEGIINFTVNQLIVVDTYPMLINCTKGIYNGTSSLREIKIVDELSEELKDRLNEINDTISEINSTTYEINETVSDINTTVTEINQTTHEIYDLLVDDLNATLTSILNLTDLTYLEVLDLETNISILDNSLTSLTTYVENKWGNEDADEIVDRLKDIRSDVTYLRSRYYHISEEEKWNLLISMREDSRKTLDLIYGKDKWWEGILIYAIPIGLILLIILIVWLARRKKKQIENFGGELNEV